MNKQVQSVTGVIKRERKRQPYTLPTQEELNGKGEGDLCLPMGWLPGVRYRQQAVIYPRFRVKMFGMSVGVVGDWSMSYVQVNVCQYLFLVLASLGHSDPWHFSFSGPISSLNHSSSLLFCLLMHNREPTSLLMCRWKIVLVARFESASHERGEE